MVVMTKDLNHRYKDGSAVGHMNGEGVGIPEDSQENSGMALNYGIEPLWFRFGILPQSPFGGPGSYADVDAERAYANALRQRRSGDAGVHRQRGPGSADPLGGAARHVARHDAGPSTATCGSAIRTSARRYEPQRPAGRCAR